ncbi:MAG: hypothetical protein ACLFV6_17830 [Spirulinaceae cyanobacterium]
MNHGPLHRCSLGGILGNRFFVSSDRGFEIIGRVLVLREMPISRP